MRSGQLHSCHMERLVCAFGAEVLQIKISSEERLQSSGNRWLGSVRRLHYRHVHRPLLQHGQRLRPQAVFRKKIIMLRLHFLPKPGKDIGDAKNWRTIALLSHICKGLGKNLSSSTCASSCKGCKSMPSWSTRDAMVILENVFTNSNHQPSRLSCLLASFLFDLEKAFDTLP